MVRPERLLTTGWLTVPAPVASRVRLPSTSVVTLAELKRKAFALIVPAPVICQAVAVTPDWVLAFGAQIPDPAPAERSSAKPLVSMPRSRRPDSWVLPKLWAAGRPAPEVEVRFEPSLSVVRLLDEALLLSKMAIFPMPVPVAELVTVLVPVSRKADWPKVWFVDNDCDPKADKLIPILDAS